MATAQFWSILTSLSAFFGGDQTATDRTVSELEKEVRNAPADHRIQISNEIATIIDRLTELKMRTAETIPPTLVAGDTAHPVENASR